eukprot:9472647-Pyramimonas_sp.AAC.1
MQRVARPSRRLLYSASVKRPIARSSWGRRGVADMAIPSVGARRGHVARAAQSRGRSGAASDHLLSARARGGTNRQPRHGIRAEIQRVPWTRAELPRRI